MFVLKATEPELFYSICFFAFILGATFYKADRNWLQLSQTSWKLAKESGVDVGAKIGCKAAARWSSRRS